MHYSPEHIALQDSVRRFVDEQINPHTQEWEAAGIFPARELFRKMGKLGFLGVNKPTQYGGLGLAYSYQIAFCEALGHIRPHGVGTGITVQSDMATPALTRFGSDALKREFLAPSIAGEVVGCIGVSEAGAGSDVASVKTRARKEGTDYVIDGSKMWITNGTQADWACLLVNTGNEGAPHRNKSLLCVPLRDNGKLVKGVSVNRIEKIGTWSSDTAQIFFEGVRVPQRNRIGDEGMGFTYQMLQFQEERLSAAARYLTALDTVVQETVDYTRQRIAFGKPILDNQVVHFRLAELMTELEALRALIYRAADIHMEGGDMTKLASMAKLKVGRLCREVSDSCLQYWGGMGFTLDNQVSRAYRDLRVISLAGGADEIMLQIICKLTGILPKR